MHDHHGIIHFFMILHPPLLCRWSWDSSAEGAAYIDVTTRTRSNADVKWKDISLKIMQALAVSLQWKCSITFEDAFYSACRHAHYLQIIALTVTYMTFIHTHKGWCGLNRKQLTLSHRILRGFALLPCTHGHPSLFSWLALALNHGTRVYPYIKKWK
jgi:hypothetical protein